MFKYAEIYGGKVREIKESALGYVEFCTIFDPSAYWLDVTGVDDIAVGYVIKFSEALGTYFEAPMVEEETVDSVRSSLLEALDYEFKQQLQKAYLLSSLGFMANAGERAKSDVDGLIIRLEADGTDTELFMTYDDIQVPVSLEDLKVLQLEIIKNGQFVYQQKWHYREAIRNACTIEALKAIKIVFVMYDFLNNKELPAVV